ncbi:uncharacterized protein EDB93DRAFT_1100197 [Suillus bovinus]|uniref:uncharacterized protein n=1 Tax=Suillus bovinus TaxID=48563 RepID=UPI001B869961|nr:uncharacterized protein EDB93DRAFT_1100197 [Suillus bovinus]KAG2159187.1 hypothetical protein EDB93DRAFT_1100197 [Suillus bovinus]
MAPHLLQCFLVPALAPPSCTLAVSLDSDVISSGSNYPHTSQQSNNSFIRLLHFTPMPNQNKPLPPLEEIMPHILRFWKAHLTDKAIVEELQKVIDTDRYEIGLLFYERGMAVSRCVIKSYFAIYESDLVHQRKARRLRQKCFWAAGINDLFAVDQHNKWLRFGLALHTGIEPFSGRIMWMNPQLILSYYLDTLMELGHTYFKHTGKSMLLTLISAQKTSGLPMDICCYVNGTIPHYKIFIPWLKTELNAYKDRVNNTTKWRNRNKVLPHGIPELIYNSPQDFGALDFKIGIEPGAIDGIRSAYINPSHTVFDLVPPTLGDHLASCYDHLGCPVITCDSIWGVYLDMLNAIQLSNDLPAEIMPTDDDELPLLTNHEDLHFQEDDSSFYYMGGVRDVSHHRQLDALLADDEPDIQLEHTDAVLQEDFNGVIVWEFTDDEGDDSLDEW